MDTNTQEEKVYVKGDVENLDLRVGDYDGLVKLTRQILREAENLPQPKVPSNLLEEGIRTSRQGSGQEKKVPITPIMKAMLEAHGESTDIAFDQGLTKTEIELNQKVKARLEAVNGPETLDYPELDNLLAKELYNVDCWRNRKDNMRDIGPGQARERAKLIVMYSKKPEFEGLLQKLETDRLLKKAVEETWQIMPVVTADTEFTETSLPFDKKHSNVGYPFFHRDNVVDQSSGKTYAQLSRELAEKQTFRTLPNYNVSLMFGRNQRLKGRLIIAESRVVNLFFNRLEAREIEALKSQCPVFAGYNDSSFLKKVLRQMAEDAMGRGFRISNWDQSKFDFHINPVWIALIGAMRVATSRGALSKKLAYWRAVFNIRQWVIDGIGQEILGIWGRMPSGFIDTNQGDSWVEVIATAYCLAKQDPEYFDQIWHVFKYVILAMGDDCLMMYRPDYFKSDTFVKDMAELGFKVNMSKYDYGAFFLQNRLKRDKGYRMEYPWPRVLKSMLFKENPRQLGTYGWLVAQLQQLSKLFEDDQSLDSVVLLTYKYDKLELGYNVTTDQVIAGIKAEDEAAKKEQKPAEWRSTAEKLYDGDPQKSDQFNEEELDSAWISQALSFVKQSVDRVRKLS